MPTAMTFNNKAITFGSTPAWLSLRSSDPYNPLGLPPYTIRLKFNGTGTPSFSKGTAVQVTSSPNVWDLTYENADWTELLRNQTSLIEVLGANTSSVTSMNGMLNNCTSLTSVPLFDTSSVTGMNNMLNNCTSLTSVPLFNTSSVTHMKLMFYNCTSLTAVPLFDTGSATNMSYMFYSCTALTTGPLFDTSSVTDMNTMFRGSRAQTSVPLFDTSSVTHMEYMLFNCRNVASGSYALYQQASSQSTPPSYHIDCFANCGVDTTTGAAELAQIPTDWGGTMSV